MGSDDEREDDSIEEPPRKKKATKKKKRRRKRSETVEETPQAKKKKRTKKSAKKKPSKSGDDQGEPKDEDAPKRRIPWLPIILVIAAVELFLFGSRGRIEICVAKEGVHDFGLVGQPRTDDNTASYPACETRLNIGMKSQYDELKTDAVVQACRRANMFRGKEAIITCAVEADGWKHRVIADFVKPWEAEYRKRLFWFLD